MINFGNFCLSKILSTSSKLCMILYCDEVGHSVPFCHFQFCRIYSDAPAFITITVTCAFSLLLFISLARSLKFLWILSKNKLLISITFFYHCPFSIQSNSAMEKRSKQIIGLLLKKQNFCFLPSKIINCILKF